VRRDAQFAFSAGVLARRYAEPQFSLAALAGFFRAEPRRLPHRLSPGTFKFPFGKLGAFMDTNEKAAKQQQDRRDFFKTAGYATAAMAGAAVIGGKLGVLDQIPGINKTNLMAQAVKAGAITDTDILNFALNLEYLEAEFYSVAVSGRTLGSLGFDLSGKGRRGETVGGNIVDLTKYDGMPEMTGKLHAVAEEIMYDEQQHVLLLRAALGDDAIAIPQINLNALNTGFSGYRHFTALARAFEDVGVSAYGGAAPLISSKEYLGVAAQIALTEAYHAGNLRLFAGVDTIPTFAVDSNDVLPPPSGKQYFTTDSKGLAIVRTTSQVLAIVYANSTSGANSGGFFPNGVNGTITTV
jgi:Ferritin-like domain